MGGGKGSKANFKGSDAEDMCSAGSLEPDPRYETCCSNVCTPGRVLRDMVVGLLVVIGIAAVVAAIFAVCFFLVPEEQKIHESFLGEAEGVIGGPPPFAEPVPEPESEPKSEPEPESEPQSIQIDPSDADRYDVSDKIQEEKVEHNHQHDHSGHTHTHDHTHEKGNENDHNHEHDHTGHDHTDHDHTGHDHTGHDHTDHDHTGHDHTDHDHTGHDHTGHDHHDHSGHSHGEDMVDKPMNPPPIIVETQPGIRVPAETTVSSGIVEHTTGNGLLTPMIPKEPIHDHIEIASVEPLPLVHLETEVTKESMPSDITTSTLSTSSIVSNIASEKLEDESPKGSLSPLFDVLGSRQTSANPIPETTSLKPTPETTPVIVSFVPEVEEKTEVPQSSTTTVANIPAETGVCHPRQLQICSGVAPWSSTAFPNWVNDSSVMDISKSLPYFRDIVLNSRCSPRALEYTCAILEPSCNKIGEPLPPCRAFCRSVASTCSEFLIKNLPQNSAFECDRFPDSEDPSICIDLAKAITPVEVLYQDNEDVISNADDVLDFTSLPDIPQHPLEQDEQNIPNDFVNVETPKSEFDYTFDEYTDSLNNNNNTSLSDIYVNTNEFTGNNKVIEDRLDPVQYPFEDLVEDPLLICDHVKFLCDDGSDCILTDQVCDEHQDCFDNSDESNCTTSTNSIEEGQDDCGLDDFKCATTDYCIPRSWVCDRADDCRDNSDEIDCDSSDLYNNDPVIIDTEDNYFPEPSIAIQGIANILSPEGDPVKDNLKISFKKDEGFIDALGNDNSFIGQGIEHFQQNLPNIHGKPSVPFIPIEELDVNLVSNIQPFHPQDRIVSQESRPYNHEIQSFDSNNNNNNNNDDRLSQNIPHLNTNEEIQVHFQQETSEEQLFPHELSEHMNIVVEDVPNYEDNEDLSNNGNVKDLEMFEHSDMIIRSDNIEDETLIEPETHVKINDLQGGESHIQNDEVENSENVMKDISYPELIQPNIQDVILDQHIPNVSTSTTQKIETTTTKSTENQVQTRKINRNRYSPINRTRRPTSANANRRPLVNVVTTARKRQTPRPTTTSSRPVTSTVNSVNTRRPARRTTQMWQNQRLVEFEPVRIKGLNDRSHLKLRSDVVRGTTRPALKRKPPSSRTAPNRNRRINLRPSRISTRQPEEVSDDEVNLEQVSNQQNNLGTDHAADLENSPREIYDSISQESRPLISYIDPPHNQGERYINPNKGIIPDRHATDRMHYNNQQSYIQPPIPFPRQQPYPSRQYW